jgi:hypothetical protein
MTESSFTTPNSRLSEHDADASDRSLELLSPEDAARQLRRSVRTIHAFVREGKLECVQQSPRVRFFLQEHIDAFIRRHTMTLPTPIDKSMSAGLPLPRKRGDKEKSTGDSVRAQLKKEMRSWR